MFRGKESSNRIELSRLVQDLLNFGVLGSLWLWGWGGGWMGVVGGAPHTCTCMCMHAQHMHTHACMVNMIISCKWLLPLDFWGIPGNSYDVICTHMHVHVCACAHVWGAPSHHPHPHPPTPHPQGGPPESVKIQ